jgi:hypothetical protein
MAVLSERRGRIAALAVLAGVVLTGCMLFDALVQEERAYSFPHRVHVEEEGLECGDCHAGWEDSEEPRLPLRAQCALCHQDLDEEKPPERRVETLFDDDRFRAAHAGALSDEILFSHQAHAERDPSCLGCHATVAESDVGPAQLGASLATSMDACVACHEESSGPKLAECSACHSEIRADAPPPSHRASWERAHGMVVRARPEARTDQCTLCHEPSSCDRCHHAELPASHDNYWRRRGHGLTASLDRDSCATCHDSDSCDRCHEQTLPQNHTGMWGAPRDQHCLFCHEPLRAEACAVCHHATPSHALATTLPADHSPGMNCRMCHGQGVPLMHVDNGQACTSCHR